MAKQVEYREFLNVIANAIIENNKQYFMAMGLATGTININDTKDDIDDYIKMMVEPMAHKVLSHTKKTIGSELIIMEDGKEVMSEYN